MSPHYSERRENGIFFSVSCIYYALGPRMGKKLHPLSERLASLGIMGAQLRSSLKPLNTIDGCDGVRGVLPPSIGTE